MANSAAANKMSSYNNIVNDEDVHGVVEATCGDLFDHIDYLLDFPKEDAADVLLLDAPAPNYSPAAHIIRNHSHEIIGTYDTIAAPMIEPLLQQQQEDHAFFDVVACGDSKTSLFDAKSNNLGSCDELDMVQLEWLSKFFDDMATPEDPYANLTCPVQPLKNSFATNTNANANTNTNANANAMPVKEDTLFGSSSPISVLENGFNVSNGGVALGVSISSSSSSMSSSSDSFSGGGSSSRAPSGPISPGTTQPPPVPAIPARARSKRSRPSAFSARSNHTISVPLAPPPASDAFTHSATMVPSSASSLSDPESIAESNTPAPPMKKKKKAKKPSISNDADEDYDEGGIGWAQGPVRRCMHCQIEKTPQWRAGPMGPKTLCNACGVRYKSGRLFPEYRPAASPTFVPSVHSNSHKKVVEMRLQTATKGDPSCDLLQLIRRKD